MKITRACNNKRHFLPLLLLGDEQETMIERYLSRGEMFVMYDDDTMEAQAVAVAVVTNEGNGVCELKNIAVMPAYQRQGFGKKMVDSLCKHFGQRFDVMKVGTGDSVATTSFYIACGFRYTHTVADFFVDNYDHPIIEEGKMLRDMLYFERHIGDR